VAEASKTPQLAQGVRLRAPREMPSPRQKRGIDKGQKRYEEILDAAAALLVSEGYAEFSTRKVAARVGIRLGNLQYYFPAKVDLVKALLDRILADSRLRVEDRIARAASADSDQVGTLVQAILEDQSKDPLCRLFFEIWALAARDPAVGRAVNDFYEEYVDKVCGALRDAAPHLERSRAARLAHLVVALLEGLMLLDPYGDVRKRNATRTLKAIRIWIGKGDEA
jgi:AcrR family transcriptional regulator